MLAKRFAGQNDFDDVITQAAQRYGVEPALIKAVIGYESSFKLNAYNPNDPGGAWGLMQVIESTARYLGHTGPMSDLFQPAIGIDLGTKYLGMQAARYQGVADTVASYNAGSVRRTTAGQYMNQTYVDRVLDLLAYFRAYEAEHGGPGVSPGPFPDGGPNGDSSPPDVPTDAERVTIQANGDSPVGTTPRLRWPVVGVATGLGVWAVLYATCAG
jgi:hypothetical protein